MSIHKKSFAAANDFCVISASSQKNTEGIYFIK